MIDDIVKISYQPTQNENKTIDDIKKKGIVKEDWTSKRKGIKSFKDNIRKHMFYQQGCKCAYCKMEMLLGCSNLQKDHIVPKNPHLEWMFLPQNICVTCDKCNNNKSDIETLVDDSVVEYPSESIAFKIIHPFFDKYSEHIEIIDDLVYKAKTEKGKFTINTCKLYRYDLAMDRARQKMKSDNPESIKSKILSLIDDTETKDTLEKEIDAIINLYKQNNLQLLTTMIYVYYDQKQYYKNVKKFEHKWELTQKGEKYYALLNCKKS